jgi:hypothetical protein
MSLLRKRRRQVDARRDLWTVAGSELLHSHSLHFSRFSFCIFHLLFFVLLFTFVYHVPLFTSPDLSLCFRYTTLTEQFTSPRIHISIAFTRVTVVGSCRIPEWVNHSSFRWVIVLLLFCSYALVSHRTSLLIFQYSWAQFSLSSWKRTPIFWARAAH